MCCFSTFHLYWKSKTKAVIWIRNKFIILNFGHRQQRNLKRWKGQRDTSAARKFS